MGSIHRFPDLTRWLPVTIFALTLASCSGEPSVGDLGPLNSRFTDSQPALSGDGRYQAFITNRRGMQDLVLYDLQRQQFIPLRGVNRRDAIIDQPSVSRSARYLVYVASDRGLPEIHLYDRIANRAEMISMGYPGWVRNPSISPDGRFVAFESGRRGQWDIEVIDRGPRVELDLPEGARATSAPVP